MDGEWSLAGVRARLQRLLHGSELLDRGAILELISGSGLAEERVILHSKARPPSLTRGQRLISCVYTV